MAKSRFLHDALQTDPRPFGPLPLLLPSLTLCFMCGTLGAHAASTASHKKAPRATITQISTSGEAFELPPAPIYSSHTAAEKATQKKATTIKAIPVHKSKSQTTALKTSAASRMVMRRSGTLRHMATEKSSPRFALTTPDDGAQRAPSDVPTTNATASQTETIASADTQPTALPAATATPIVAAATAPPALTVEVENNDAAVPVTGTIPIQATPPATLPSTSDTTGSGASNSDGNTVGAPADVNLTSSEDANDEALEALPDGPVSATIGPRAASTRPGANQPALLYAPRISYDRGVIIAHGDVDNPVRLESNDTRIIANEVQLDTVAKTVKAAGTVRVERKIAVNRFVAARPQGIKGRESQKETITETLQGENFEYNFGTKQGNLDSTRIRLENFNITAEHLIINGDRTIARNVIIWPGGLSDEELKIYGTPPFNLHAHEVIIDRSKVAPAETNSADTHQNDAPNTTPGGPRTEVHGAALYFKNLRLLPVPSALLKRSGNPREESTYQITPRIYNNSSDGILLTTRLQFPLTHSDAGPGKSKGNNPNDLMLTADVGISTKVGFRGGVDLDSHSRLGELKVGAHLNDVVSSQLTDRIQLDRLPEVLYRPPALPLFNLPGGRRAGFRFSFVAGDYRESFTSENREVNDTRLQGQATFTTRLNGSEGPYLDLFARGAHYGSFTDNYTSLGFEVGYVGRLGRRINGQFSFSAQNVSGATPFRFDRVEIRRELRTTFDILLTPRYIIPVDLRYDVDLGALRDETFGLLRNYKTFAYGVVYQTSRHELRLELRQGF